jgi:hypothetical protein
VVGHCRVFVDADVTFVFAECFVGGTQQRMLFAECRNFDEYFSDTHDEGGYSTSARWKTLSVYQFF